MSDDLARMAAGLTKVQREGLLRAPCPSWWGAGPACMPYRRGTADALAARRLCLSRNPMMRWGNVRPLTPLGIVVRRHLKEQADEQ